VKYLAAEYWQDLKKRGLTEQASLVREAIALESMVGTDLWPSAGSRPSPKVNGP